MPYLPFFLTRLRLISEVRVEPRDRHYSKAWVITSLCTHTLEYLSGIASCICNTNAPLSLIWAAYDYQIENTVSLWQLKQNSQQFTKNIKKYEQQFPVFHVAVTRFQGKVIDYLSYCLHFLIGMKLHDSSCYTNSWDLKETGKIPEFEKPVGEENRDCLRSSEQLGLWTPPPKRDKC